MAYTPISELPVAPSRQDDGETFSNKADAFVAALPTFRTETNAAGSYIDSVGTQVDADKVASEAAQVAAEAAQAAAETSETNAATSETNAEYWAGVAGDSVATLPEGTINDSVTGPTTAWSSQKISTEIASSGTKGTLTVSAVNGGDYFVDLSAPATTPIVSVTKEVPQIGETNNNWSSQLSGAYFDREDFSPNADLIVELLGYELENASYDSVSFSVSAQDTSPYGLFFKPDGTKMYVVGTVNDSVFQYSLSTPWDLSTASYDSVSFSVAAQETNIRSLSFKPDGTKMYVVGLNNDTVYQYTLSTPWDLSTASYDSVSFSVSAQDSDPRDLSFKPDGTKLYILGNTNDAVFQYILSTPWDISTASYDSVSFSVGAQDGNPLGLSFKPDGTKMYVLGNTNDAVFQYILSTPWDISTASYDSVSFSVSAQDSSPLGLSFKPDGTKMYVLGFSNDAVFQYTSANSSAELSIGSFTTQDVGKTVEYSDVKALLLNTSGDLRIMSGAPVAETITSGNWGLFSSYFEGNTLKYAGLDEWGNVSTASYDSVSFSVSAQEGNPYGLSFKPDGTKLYILGNTNDAVFQYTLSTPWDLSTASYDSISFSVSAQETNIRSLSFKPDGTKMYVVGLNNDTVYQYTLSTPWDLSTASYDSVSFSVSAQDGSPYDLSFKSDGTKLYILGNTNDAVFQYTLSTPWDISTASYDSVSFSVSAQDSNPYGLSFKPDGTKMYVLGNINDSVFQYSLSTPWDISTASYDSVSFSVGAQEGNPYGLSFKPDGTKLYVLGLNNDTIYQYTLTGNITVVAQDPAVTVTNTSGQIATSYWTDINSISATDDEANQTLAYAISLDDKSTFEIVQTGLGSRNIIRNNLGTWEYNSNPTYGSESWTAASENTLYAAMREAIGVPVNLMTSADLASVTDTEFPALGNELDLVMVMDSSVSSQLPYTEGVGINYDGNIADRVAVNGTDYTADALTDSLVRITALADNNLKIRVV